MSEAECNGEQCCCSCVFHLPDHSHPAVGGGAVITRKGWICAPIELEPIAFSGWAAHGMCECYIKRPTAAPSASR